MRTMLKTLAATSLVCATFIFSNAGQANAAGSKRTHPSTSQGQTTDDLLAKYTKPLFDGATTVAIYNWRFCYENSAVEALNSIKCAAIDKVIATIRPKCQSFEDAVFSNARKYSSETEFATDLLFGIAHTLNDKVEQKLKERSCL
jgi:hypothetical protein